MTEAHVIKLFTRFGKINSERYLYHQHGPHAGQPRGFAFVDFARRADAEAAIEALNGRQLCGRTLTVRWSTRDAVPEPDAPSAQPALSEKDVRELDTKIMATRQALDYFGSKARSGGGAGLEVVGGHPQVLQLVVATSPH